MKKSFLQHPITLLTIVLLMISGKLLFAETPDKMSYQAVVRNSNNELVKSSDIGMRISIIQGTTNGAEVYFETQVPSTNANGLVSIEIGGTNDFMAIDWSDGPHFIKTEIDLIGGTNYTITGISQILTVPFAFYAKYAETADYDKLSNLPDLFDGEYSSLSGTPLIPSDISDLSDEDNILFNGDYNSLSNLPDLFDGEYSSLSGTPYIPADISDLSDEENILFNGDYNSLENQPELFDGEYSSLSGTPNIPDDLSDLTDEFNLLFDRDYNSLNNLPELFDGDYNNLDNLPLLNISEWNEAYSWGNHVGQYHINSWMPTWHEVSDKPDFADIATSGNFEDLINTPTTLSGYGITDAISVEGGQVHGVISGSTENASISGFNASFINVLTITYTLSNNDNGKILNVDQGSEVTIVVPNELHTGFNCLVIQAGEGQVVFVESTSTINNRNGFTKTAGRFAIATIVHLGNDVFITSGDMTN